MTYVLIAIGGATGALARYVLDTLISERAGGLFPWGTLVVNVSGSFVLGVLYALTVERGVLPPEARAALLIGFLGAYTTFSTFMLESFRLVEEEAYMAALVNTAGSVVLGFAAVVAGIAIGRFV
jgi:CrcB protein